ncbi:hypothetical protein MGN70_009395 [Eutypa lata]|nr:hypothetical protein MGN70_009395 [Eutypa lata]
MAPDESLSVWSACTTSTAESSHEQSSYHPSDEDPPTDEDDALIGEEGDPLMPSFSDVDRTFHDGKATWETFLNQARSMPSGLWPAGMLDPYITLVDVPGLPQQLPRGAFLYGRPRWRVPLDAEGTGNVSDKFDGDLTLTYGRRVSFRLQVRNPIHCDIGPNVASYFLGSSTETTNSLAVLTLCWSYILSVQLLEMQGREVEYSKHRLWPHSDKHLASPMIDLGTASPALVRWLCAVLSPDLGWNARDKGLLPPWTASIKTGIQLIVSAPVSAADMLLPPSSSDAMELFIELCRLFRLGTDLRCNSRWESISPYKAAFFAALMLPFYSYMELQPQLPPPHLSRAHGNSTFNTGDEQNIRQYKCDLPYFMTLSIHPPSLGSILWSIFWQPDIHCNLVSPWLASFIDALTPTIDERRAETLVKVFISRRPRVGIWWLALFLLGDLSVLGWIQRYAATLEEKYGFGSLSPPDPMVSVWTGSKQSFLDLKRDGTYRELSDSVSRADLLRCRFDMKLQDAALTTLSWLPFGHIQKRQVEPELWPQLEIEHTRQYHSFTWYPGGKPSTPSYGFRRDTGRHVENVLDDLGRRSFTTKRHGVCRCDIKSAPSKESTRRMMSFLVEDVAGNRDWANAASLSKNRDHRWLRDWEGLDIIEGENETSPAVSGTKQSTWLLMEWISGRYAVDR